MSGELRNEAIYDEHGCLVMTRPELAAAEATTTVRFDTIPIDKIGPFTAKLGGTMACEVTCARLWLDVEQLGESIGQRIRINGPHVAVGVLRSFDYDEATDTARFTIETDRGT